MTDKNTASWWKAPVASAAGTPLPNCPEHWSLQATCAKKAYWQPYPTREAEYDDIRAAYEAGFTHAAHFYNAMPGFHKRREYKYEGTVESVYLTDGMTIELIADGIHLPSTILKLAYKTERRRAHLPRNGRPLLCRNRRQGNQQPARTSSRTVCASLPTVPALGRQHRHHGPYWYVPWYKRPKFRWQTPYAWLLKPRQRIMGVYDRKGSLQKGQGRRHPHHGRRNLNIRAVWQAGKLVQENFLNYK